MELACRGYMDDPAEPPTPETWPAAYSEAQAAPMRAALADVLKACLAFAGADQ
jgi:formiminoglutamase